MKKLSKLVFGFCIVTAFSLIILAKLDPTVKPRTQSKIELTKLQKEFIYDLQQKDMLRLNIPAVSAYIYPGLWNKLDIKAKEELSAGLAIYVGNKRGNHSYRINVYDKMTGKELAKYSQTWGFSVD